jgi:hypothetical protein
MNHRAAVPRLISIGSFPPIAPPTRGPHSMPNPPITSRELVDRLDARHEELIARLDELNAQIEAALAEFGRSRETAAGDERSRNAA